MHEVVFFDTLRQALWVAVLISTPMLAVALVAGVGVGLFQALTSVQEMTLTFVPKLAALLVTYWIAMGFMTGTIVAFWHDTILPAIGGSP